MYQQQQNYHQAQNMPIPCSTYLGPSEPHVPFLPPHPPLWTLVWGKASAMMLVPLTQFTSWSCLIQCGLKPLTIQCHSARLQMKMFLSIGKASTLIFNKHLLQDRNYISRYFLFDNWLHLHCGSLRGQVICLQSHSCWEAILESKPKRDSKDLALFTLTNC